MNILHFLGISGVGGIEKQFQRFINYFDAHKDQYNTFKHSVLSYSTSIHQDLKDDVNRKCVHVHIFKKTFPDILCPPLIRPFRCSRLFNKYHYDALITTSILRNRIQEKTIALFPGTNIFYDKGWSTQYSRAYSEKLKIFDGFIANSISTKNTLIRKFNIPSNAIKLLYNSYPEHFENIDKTKARSLINSRFNVDDSDKIVLCIGRFIFLKGITVLIEAFQHIKNRNIKLLLVGSGKILNTIQKLINDYQMKDRVITTGYSNAPETFYAASDLFVIPSCREPFGIVLLEAGISRLPVLANNIDGIRDTVLDERYGYLIEPEKEPGDFPYIDLKAIPDEVYYPQREELAPPLFPDPVKLAEKIEYALAHTEESKERADMLFQRVKSEFTLQNYTDTFHALISGFYTKSKKESR